MKRNVSLGDIANKLGVSRTLVSLVLNNKADENGISKNTQKKVLKLARELNYKPNLMARGLRMGKTNTVGLIVSDIANPFYSKMARHIEDYLSQSAYHLIICSTDESPEKEESIIKLMREKQLDGLIISSSQKKPDLFRQLLREEYPFVLIDRKHKNVKTNFVGTDNYTATKNAIRYLIEKGHQKIATMAISPMYISSISERVNAYLDALEEASAGYGKKHLIGIPYNTVRTSVKKEMKKLMEGKDKVTALFAVNNNVAVACLEAFSELNIKIPTDISFLSFDDIEAFRLTSPPVTAIDQPLSEICRNTVDILLSEIKKYKKTKKQLILVPELIVRGSIK